MAVSRWRVANLFRFRNKTSIPNMKQLIMPIIVALADCRARVLGALTPRDAYPTKKHAPGAFLLYWLRPTRCRCAIKHVCKIHE